VDVTVQSDPAGLTLTADDATGATPLTVTQVVGHLMTLEAPSPQQVGGTTYTFGSWSDGGDATHAVTVPDTATTYTATYG
jgi:hypothetical protein